MGRKIRSADSRGEDLLMTLTGIRNDVRIYLESLRKKSI